MGPSALPRRHQRYQLLVLPRPRPGRRVRRLQGRQGRLHLLRQLPPELLQHGLPGQPGCRRRAGGGAAVRFQRHQRHPRPRWPVLGARGGPHRRAGRLGGAELDVEVRCRRDDLRRRFHDDRPRTGAQYIRAGAVHAGPGAGGVQRVPRPAQGPHAGLLQRHRWWAGQWGVVQLTYETFRFYESRPVVNLVAPPASPPPSLSPAGQNENTTKGSGNAATAIAIALGVLVAVLASVLIICFWRKRQSAKQHAEEDGDAGSLLFYLITLRKATSNFAEENKLGHGGFGEVYKGFLADERPIAVKRLDKDSGQGLKELRNGLLLVAKLRHNNLAKLLGVCLKGKEKLHVYEYLPNRSLDTFLFAPEKRQLLDWDTRYCIIYGTARGLLYLHEDSQVKIIHRDLKASNVLLDADMNPKISDFGLARLFSGDKTTTITSQVVGSL